MNYAQIRKVSGNGDVLLVRGRGVVSALIRVLTGESFSHVALLLWIGETLWVAEVREFRGYRLTPASLWVEDAVTRGDRLWYGRAPSLVARARGVAGDAALQYRNRPYSYRTLVRVWVSQLLGRKVTGALVCSTFVQRVWEACEVEFSRTADPGDIWAKCEGTVKVAA